MDQSQIMAELRGLDRLKYIGYCLSSLPPDNIKATFEDFVNFAKFQLCFEKKILFLDPIWDRYTDEAIISEWYGLLFSTNDKVKEEFMRFLLTGKEDKDWLDTDVERNREEIEKLKKLQAEGKDITIPQEANSDLLGAEDVIEFSPEDLKHG